MSAEKASLNTVARRTRSGWDAFYRNQYDEMNKKNPDRESNIKKRLKKNVDSINIEDLESDKDYKQKPKQKKRKRQVVVEEDSERYESHEDHKLKETRKKVVVEDSGSDSNEDSYKTKRVEKKKKKKKGTRKFVVADSEGEFDEDCEKQKYARNKGTRKIVKKKARKSGEFDSISKLIDSLWSERGSLNEKTVLEKKKYACQCEDHDEYSVPEKTEREKEIEYLFRELEMGLWESEISNMQTGDECTGPTDIDESPAARCGRGEHDHVLDEEIGIVCRYCSVILLEIKYVLPPFYKESGNRRERKYSREDVEESRPSFFDRIHLRTSKSGSLESKFDSKGTVLDLIPKGEKRLYPHQIEGFEFLWRNIAGDIHVKNLEKLPANGGNGCIISHAPGTGKTRLTIVFLETFMKMYPKCLPVIIAPKGMLLTWEQELRKWEVDINFHNLNEPKLTSHENATAGSIPGNYENTTDYFRFVKLHSWKKGGGILGISYRLFESLAGEKNHEFKKTLLESPGLLIMDEGHTPRNKGSLMWKALTNVKTQRRVILSGTPFQNNFTELYNTLSLVNPRFTQQIGDGKNKRSRDEWANLTNSITKNTNDDSNLKKLRLMMEPFVHVHKGSILQKTLPGIKDCLVILKPTKLQMKLLENVTRVEKYLEQGYLESLISVHPSLVSDKPEFSEHKTELKRIENKPNAGVKTRFLIELIKLSVKLNEKVLIFSQYIDPLVHIKQMLKSEFSWYEDREVIYMDGECSITHRQCSINCFNEKKSEAKVLLASQRACSEGINLVGASRVVLLDVVWNPAVERQAISRAYRIGQEKVVYVYHLVTLMEVKKFTRQAEKERISEMVFAPAVVDGGGTAAENVVDKEDKVLEAMVGDEGLGCIFERIVNQPKEADLVNTFGFVDDDKW